MKLKEGFITHEADGEQIMVSTGSTGFSGLVRSNRTAASIVDCLKSETSESEIVKTMLEKYDVPRETICKDVKKILDTLRSIGAIDE